MARQFLGLAVLLVVGVVVDNTFADEPERIVGGSRAALGELPYQVSLSTVDYGFHCGGSLVTPQHVITAAHCVDLRTTDELLVRTGSLSVTGGELHRVKSYKIHPEYNPDPGMSMKNDIAVITLTKPIKESKYQKSIPTAPNDPPHGTPLIVSGWGMTGVGEPGADYLQKATVYMQSKEKCRQLIPKEAPLYDSHVCALHSPGIGVCGGDSGGPLVYDNMLVGVVSWAYSCALGYPDVYVKASHFHDFITKAILEG